MRKNVLRTMIFTAVMASMVFVTTYFIRWEIATPAGPTMIKAGNIICLLSGLLFGGLSGGLAAGIGSMFFDLLNPVYASSAPFTFVFFFVMGAVCGWISHSGGSKGLCLWKNILGAVCGAASYFILNISKSIFVLMLAGSAFWPAVAANAIKMVTSGINAVIAVTCSVLLAPLLHRALHSANILD